MLRIGYGLTDSAENSGGTMAVTSTIANVSGTVLFLYSYAPKDQMEWTRLSSRDWSDRILASNSEIPQPGENSDFWKKTLSRFLIGAVVAGLFGLVSFFGGIVIWQTRQKT